MTAAGEYVAVRRAVGLLHLDRRRGAAAVLAGSAGLGSAVALAAVSAWLIARASQMPPVLDLTIAVVSVRALGISRAVFRYLERLASHEVALRGVAALREEVYRRLAAGRTDAVVGLRRGDLLARTGADVDAVGDLVVRALLPGAVSAVVSLGAVVLVAAFLPAAALVLLLSLLLAGVLSPWLTARAARISERAVLGERAEISATAMTAVESAAEVQVTARTTAILAALAAADARLARATDRAARPAAAAAGLNLLAMGIAVVGALLIGIPATTAGGLAPVELAVVVLVPLAAFEATGMLPAAAIQLVRSAGAAERVLEILDRAEAPPPSEAADAGAAAAPTPGEATTVVARDVACGWPGGPTVVEHLDVEVSPGRFVAVVGPSGVGKTTALLTLAGLVPPHSGDVLVAGRSPWTLDRRSVSAHVVLTAEDAHVFDTTVLENLRVGRGDVTPQDAQAALEVAGLQEWLDGLPQGVDTRLGSDGTTISGGERRRLLLARALLAAAPVLLLDEVTEHLDSAAADALMGDLQRTAATAGRGVLVVTHRLSALGGADEVIVLGPSVDPHGAPIPGAPARVVDRGTHGDLLRRLPAYAWAAAQEHTEITARALPRGATDHDSRSDATR